jgi:hypothetical protein
VFAKLVLIQAQPAFAGFSWRNNVRTSSKYHPGDIACAIRAAKQTGAAEVEVRIGTASVVIRIEPSTTPETALAKLGQISP